MFFKLNLPHLFMLTLSINIGNVFPLDSSQHVHKELSKEENMKTPAEQLGLNSSITLKINQDNHMIKIPLVKPSNEMGQSLEKVNMSSKDPLQLVLEGGGTADLKSTVKPNLNIMGSETIDESTDHSKGSKPRKGVDHPGSSVVPRKGVNPLGALNSGGTTQSPTQESTSIISDKQMPLNRSESKIPKVTPYQEEPIKQTTPSKIPHHKKPVVVTDTGDVDDFDNYPIIQTSTTGEDYIIIGIVIVLGIWCSIFGALIFYRRAGEYWDRRHYRRMDFLVEGMYND